MLKLCFNFKTPLLGGKKKGPFAIWKSACILFYLHHVTDITKINVPKCPLSVVAPHFEQLLNLEHSVPHKAPF